MSHRARLGLFLTSTGPVGVGGRHHGTQRRVARPPRRDLRHLQPSRAAAGGPPPRVRLAPRRGARARADAHRDGHLRRRP
eukprot:7517915-Pyramimonas_sp.AAC.1